MTEQRKCTCRFDPAAERNHRPRCAMVSTPTPAPTATELHHLLNRAIDGVVLHGESDRLRELVRELEHRVEQAEQEVTDMATAAALLTTLVGKRAERAEAAIERVQAELHALNSEVRGLVPVALAGRRDAVSRIRNALDQPQQPTITEQHPDVQGRCPACAGAGLFLGSGGHVTCPRLDCPNPTAADDLLNQRAHDWAAEQQPTTTA